MSQSVTWPAILKYSGDDELAYVEDEQQWITDDDLCGGHFESSDRLLDSRGQLFALASNGGQSVVLALTDETLTDEQLANWLRNHFAVTGACCVAKINVASLSDCMAMLRQNQDT